MCFQGPKQLRKQEVFLLTKLHWMTHTPHVILGGEWKQQQLFVAGPGPPLPKNALLLYIFFFFFLNSMLWMILQMQTAEG